MVKNMLAKVKDVDVTRLMAINLISSSIRSLMLWPKRRKTKLSKIIAVLNVATLVLGIMLVRSSKRK